MRHLHNLFGGLACSETLHGHAWCTNTKWQTAALLIQWNTADMCSSRLYLDSLAWFRPRIFFKLIESPTKKPVVPPSHSVIFLFLRLFIFCRPTFSTPSLFFRLTLELNVSFLVAPHCRVSATSQAYSLWKLFSPEQTAHFFFFADSTRPMDSLCPTGRALLIILWAQYRVNTLTFYIHIADPRLQLIFVLHHIKHSCSYLFMLNPQK